jgi:hypothetical protein
LFIPPPLLISLIHPLYPLPSIFSSFPLALISLFRPLPSVYNFFIPPSFPLIHPSTYIFLILIHPSPPLSSIPFSFLLFLRRSNSPLISLISFTLPSIYSTLDLPPHFSYPFPSLLFLTMSLSLSSSFIPSLSYIFPRHSFFPSLQLRFTVYVPPLWNLFMREWCCVVYIVNTWPYLDICNRYKPQYALYCLPQVRIQRYSPSC